MQHDVWIITLCALVVAGRAMQRYDTPETNRLTTTRNLFLFSAACYVMASVAVYWVLSEIILKPGVLQILGVQDVTNLLARYTAPPVLAAVLLTTLLPQVPGLKAADGFMLERFQKLGRIPYGVSHLADQLTLNRLGLTQFDLKASADWIRAEPDVPNDLIARLQIADPGTSEGLFTTLLVLHRSVSALWAEPAYGRFFRKQSAVWDQLKAHFEVFAAQSQAFFVLFDQLTPRASADASNKALKTARRRYLAFGEEFRVATADFTARALTAVEPSGAAISQRLRRLGFATEEIACPKLPIGEFLFMGSMLVVALLAVVCLVPPRSETMPGPLVAFVIGATQTCALLLAVLPKLRWAFFRPKPEGGMPYLGWLAAAAAAGVLALVIDRGVLALVHRDLGFALPSQQTPLAPSCIMAAALTLAIGILCDLDLGIGRFRRLAEGALAGSAMVFAIALCLGLLKLPSATRDVAPVWWFPFALSFALGFVPGSIAPHLYRAARAEPQAAAIVPQAVPAGD